MKKLQTKIKHGESASVAYCKTPIGWLKITADSMHVCGIEFKEKGQEKAIKNPLLLSCKKQLKEYFAGTRTAFTLPLCPAGTAFTKQVWKTMQTVKFGKSITYGALAKSIRRPSAFRAVGTACGKNPILIVIPCHRVRAVNGLGGFSAGLHRKRWLIAHEDKTA